MLESLCLYLAALPCGAAFFVKQAERWCVFYCQAETTSPFSDNICDVSNNLPDE